MENEELFLKKKQKKTKLWSHGVLWINSFMSASSLFIPPLQLARAAFSPQNVCVLQLENLKVTCNGKCNTPVVDCCQETKLTSSPGLVQTAGALCLREVLLEGVVSYAWDRKWTFLFFYFIFFSWGRPIAVQKQIAEVLRGNYRWTLNLFLFTTALDGTKFAFL